MSTAKNRLGLFLDKDICLDSYYVTDGESIFNHHLESGQSNISLKGKKVYAIIDENTMSSAEYIFALGLKKAYDCILIGQPTMGLSGQCKIYNIDNLGELRVTTKKYINCNGTYVSNIKPDYTVVSDIGSICNGIDTQLNYIIDKETKRIVQD